MIDRSVLPAGIVVGVDGDPATLQAVAWAAREADGRGLPLDLIQVLPPSDRPSTELRAASGRALALLDQARRTAVGAAPGLAPRLSVVDGVVAAALVAVAHRAHLLVLGSRGFDSMVDLTLGRTLVHAMGHAACPVIVVPPAWDSSARHTGPVVVGVDGSPESQGAIAFAADVADRWRSPVTAVGVASRHGGDADAEEHRRVLAETVAGLATRYPDVRPAEELRHGSPGEELSEAGHDATLVVVGSRGRGSLAGPLVGSTSQAVVRSVSCPVAVLSTAAAARWTSPDHAWAEEGV